MIRKLVIGTANFGLRYGIANDRKLDSNEAFAILDYAHEEGIQWIDTARAYGDAELLVGEFFAKRGKVFNVIGKLPAKEYLSAQTVEDEIFGSLRNMNLSSIDALLVHSFDTCKRYESVVIPVLRSLCRDNVIGTYGVSVYHPDDVVEMMRMTDDKLVFEFPLNLFDQRFLIDAFLQEMKGNGNLLFARSVFLQGLFFLGESALGGRFEAVRGNVKTLRDLSAAHNMRPECTALLFAVMNQWVDGVVIGVDSIQQLKNNMECLRPGHNVSYSDMEPSLLELAVSDEEIILPYKWRIGDV
ncbi:MAG: aldo/keto reductase [Nitrospirae bacterium]|nr:aldo/keto reductase [Nitrospirota bacterium]